VELADEARPGSWADAATALIGPGVMTSMTDAASGMVRIAITDENGLCGAFFAAHHPVSIARGWVVEAFGAGISPGELLAGRAGGALPDRGAIVCSCNDVGINTILAAIDAGAVTTDSIGLATCAGTTCGSCRSEITSLLMAASRKVAAE
jgi:assimilatory nitrate reductase catalytic subunit